MSSNTRTLKSNIAQLGALALVSAAAVSLSANSAAAEASP